MVGALRLHQTASRAPNAPLPDDILERFMTVSRIAIDWYLQNPDLLGLLGAHRPPAACRAGRKAQDRL